MKVILALSIGFHSFIAIVFACRAAILWDDSRESNLLVFLGIVFASLAAYFVLSIKPSTHKPNE